MDWISSNSRPNTNESYQIVTNICIQYYSFFTSTHNTIRIRKSNSEKCCSSKLIRSSTPMQQEQSCQIVYLFHGPYSKTPLCDILVSICFMMTRTVKLCYPSCYILVCICFMACTVKFCYASCNILVCICFMMTRTVKLSNPHRHL